MELLQLQYFCELARTGHLSRTAEKLHIAQPSLSQTLKRLESELGVSLFDRVGNRIVLNNSGRIFLSHVEEIFATLNRAKVELESSLGRKKQTVSLYICSASMFLPEIIRRIQYAAPDIRLQIFHRPADGQSEYPGLYLTSSPVCPEEDPCSEILLKEQIKAALPAGHPLAEKFQLKWTDLKDEPFLSLDSESDLTTAVLYYCRLKGISPNVTTYADSPAVMRELLRLKLGTAFVPECTWRGFAPDTVVLRNVEDLPMERYLLLSWKSNVYPTPAWELCKDIITEYFATVQA